MKCAQRVISVLVIAVLLSFTVASAAYADCIPFSTAPNLYQVTRNSSTSATLYFTPLNDSIQSYLINYGLSKGDARYSVNFNSGPSTGAIAYIVNGLDPAFTYYYEVSATNSCSQSPWSEWVSDASNITTQGGVATPTPVLSGPPVAGSGTLMVIGVLSAALIGGGVTFYRKANRLG